MSTALREFLAWVLCMLKTSVQGVASWLVLGWGTVWRALRCAAGPAPPDLISAHLALDEVYFKRGQYLTVLRDGLSGKPLSTALGRGSAAARAVLEQLPPGARERVLTLSCDLHRAYRKAAYDLLPQVHVVANCFHLVRLACTEARQAPPAVRPQQWRACRRLRALLRQRGQVACERLARWLSRCEALGDCLPRTLRTLRQWQLEIEGYLLTGLSNGRAEAQNSNVALLRHLARGYHNQHNFAARIMSLASPLHH